MPTIAERIDQTIIRVADSTSSNPDLYPHLWDMLRAAGVSTLGGLRDLPDAVAAGVLDKLDGLIAADTARAPQVTDERRAAEPVDPTLPWWHGWAPTAEFGEGEETRGAPAAGDDALPNLSLPEHQPDLYEERLSNFPGTINRLADIIHAANIHAGWWTNIHTGEPKARNVGEMLALIHSEVSEALEHWRKGTMDDKLLDRPGIEVELADVLIRVADLASSLQCDLGGAVVAKLLFNASRADHKIENRLKPGGKAA